LNDTTQRPEFLIIGGSNAERSLSLFEYTPAQH
jgi:hypothetical protein